MPPRCLNCKQSHYAYLDSDAGGVRHRWFQKAAEYSALVSLGIPVIIITFVLLLFAILFIDNTFATVSYWRRRFRVMMYRGTNFYSGHQSCSLVRVSDIIALKNIK